MACTPLLHLGGRLKSLEKSLLAGMGVQNFYFCGRGVFLLELGARNFEVKIRMA